MLHRELTERNHVEISIKNRITKSEFSKYTTETLNTTEKQTTANRLNKGNLIINDKIKY